MGIENLSPLGDRLEFGEARRPEYGPIWLDMKSRSVQLEGTDMRESLGPSEYQLLWLLIRAQGGHISAAEVVRFLYEDDEADIPLGNVVPVFISRVRVKLDKLTQGKVTIETNPSGGYSLALH